MKLPFSILRSGLGLAASIFLVSLTACTGPQERSPGPHQGSGVSDGKDVGVSVGIRVGTGTRDRSGRRAGVAIQPGDTTEGINFNSPGPHQIMAKCGYDIYKDPITQVTSVTLTIPVVTTGDDLDTANGKRQKHRNRVKVVVYTLQGDEKHAKATMPEVQDN